MTKRLCCNGTCEPCRECIGSWSVTGARCFAVGAVRVRFRGMFFTADQGAVSDTATKAGYSLWEAPVICCAVNQLLKSVVPEIGTLRCVGVGGG